MLSNPREMIQKQIEAAKVELHSMVAPITLSCAGMPVKRMNEVRDRIKFLQSKLDELNKL